MSKASEWAKSKPKTWSGNDVQVRVSRFGDLEVCDQNEYVTRILCEIESHNAISLAKWIIETFGEPTGEEGKK